MRWKPLRQRKRAMAVYCMSNAAILTHAGCRMGSSTWCPAQLGTAGSQQQCTLHHCQSICLGGFQVDAKAADPALQLCCRQGCAPITAGCPHTVASIMVSPMPCWHQCCSASSRILTASMYLQLDCCCSLCTCQEDMCTITASEVPNVHMVLRRTAYFVLLSRTNHIACDSVLSTMTGGLPTLLPSLIELDVSSNALTGGFSIKFPPTSI